MGSLSDSHVVDGHPSIKLDITMAMDKDFGNREAAMTLRDMAESVLGDDESLGDILIAGDSKFPGYKVKANEIDALDKLLFYRPAFVNATLRSGGRRGGGSNRDSGTTAGERGPTRPMTRMVIQVLGAENEQDGGEDGGVKDDGRRRRYFLGNVRKS